MAKKTTKKKKGKNKTKKIVKKLTDEEQKRLDKYHLRRKNESVKLKIAKESNGNNCLLEPENPDDPLLATKFMEAFGTAAPYLIDHLFNQVSLSFTGVASKDGADKEKLVKASNAAMALLDGIRPQDEIEAMLAVQMIGVHNMAMETLRRSVLGNQTFEGKQANVNQSTKMLRTFTAQMETLKKYRTGGQQKMIVEHVNVNEGGQAIVGTVNQGGGKNEKSCE